MQLEKFLKLSELEKCNALLHISNQVVKILEDNSSIYPVAINALKKAKIFLRDNNTILAKQLSIFLNNPNEMQDLGMLVYSVNNTTEEQALDIIIYTIGFIAHTAHIIQNSIDDMPPPVIEAKDYVVYEAFNIFADIKNL